MMKITNDEILRVLPSFFETNLNSDASASTVFERLATIFDYEQAYIYYLNPEGAQLKFSANKDNDEIIDTIFKLPPKESENFNTLYSQYSSIPFNFKLRNLSFLSSESIRFK